MSSIPVTRATSDNSTSPNCWTIAVAAVFMQIALGAVYGWNVFLNPVMTDYHLDKPGAYLAFTSTIIALGVTAGFGGFFQARFGPRAIATVGGILYGVGIILAGLTTPNFSILYITYGIIGGIGLGLAYIVPLAMLLKWFPDRRGFITGLAVAGFGLGATVSNFALLLALAVLVGLCYGRGFGTMPAFAADFFGPKNSGTIYGVMLTAWSAGAAVGPILIASMDYRTALVIIAVIMVVSAALPLFTRFLINREQALGEKARPVAS